MDGAWSTWADTEEWRQSGWPRTLYRPCGCSLAAGVKGSPWASLANLLVCESCGNVKTRHARQVVQEIDSYYCPQTLDNLPSSEAALHKNRSAKTFCCVVCSNVLSIQATTVAAVAAAMGAPLPEDQIAEEAAQEPRYYFICQHCRWDSIDAGLIGEKPEDLLSQSLAEEGKHMLEETNLMSSLVEHFQALEKKNLQTAKLHREMLTGRKSGKSPKSNKIEEEDSSANKLWRWEECDASSRKKQEENFQVPVLALPDRMVSCLDALAKKKGQEREIPGRIALRTKQSLRCRQCVEGGLANIILKPQINPLKGDSSMRTNVGAWFKKKSLAYDLLPRFVARFLPEHPESIFLAVTNPRDIQLRVSLNNESPFLLDAFDEVEEIDMFSSIKPPKGGPPIPNDDPSIVQSRIGHKVLLNLPLEGRVLPLVFHVDCHSESASGGSLSTLCFDLQIS